MIRKRIPRDLACALRMVGGTCPACAFISKTPNKLGPAFEAVIYRLSHRSITFRHDECGAQWTMTLANLHKVASKRKKDHVWYKWTAWWTKDAAKNEKRGRLAAKGRRRAAGDIENQGTSGEALAYVHLVYSNNPYPKILTVCLGKRNKDVNHYRVLKISLD